MTLTAQKRVENEKKIRQENTVESETGTWLLKYKKTCFNHLTLIYNFQGCLFNVARVAKIDSFKTLSDGNDVTETTLKIELTAQDEKETTLESWGCFFGILSALTIQKNSNTKTLSNRKLVRGC